MRPVVVIAGDPVRCAPVIALLEANDCAALIEAPPFEEDRLIRRLTDEVAALLLVDGDHPDWRFPLLAAKRQQATRRIPVWVAASHAALEEIARAAGADGFVLFADLADQLIPIVRQHGRVPGAAWISHLADQCAEDLPPRAREGIARFNAGEYYAQHDLFEALWMEEHGPVRELYRAILQVGIAYYQIERGNHRGALRMLLRSVQWLSLLPEVCRGVDVGGLRDDAQRVRAALEALNPTEIDAFDRTLLRPVRLLQDADPTTS
jgi:predicted metal-dependent hydrolase